MVNFADTLFMANGIGKFNMANGIGKFKLAKKICFYQFNNCLSLWNFIHKLNYKMRTIENEIRKKNLMVTFSNTSLMAFAIVQHKHSKNVLYLFFN
jgi:hypothetical protein